MENKASITALMSAFGRAFHAENEEYPVFNDCMAKKLMSNDEYNMLSGYILSGIDFFAPEKKNGFKSDKEALSYIVNTHIAPTPLCRAAYCESALETAFRTGTEQYVILGAGLDTFAFRKSEIAEKHKIYEVDHPATQSDKILRIERAGWTVPQNLVFVGVDFTKNILKEELEKYGFDKTKKTIFSWLGVSYYLYRDEIENMLRSLSEIMSDGSTLLFDYADAGLFLSKEPRVRNMIEMAKGCGEEMKSSFDGVSMEMMLSDYGFLVYEILEPADIQKQIIKNTGMKAFEHINYVQAVYKKLR